MPNETVGIKGTVVAVLTNTVTGEKKTVKVKNIVTNEGDRYYAERGALLTPGATISPVPLNFTDAFGAPDMEMSLFTTGAAPTKSSVFNTPTSFVTGSTKAMDSGYPKTNDVDADNTGAAIDSVTYLVSYLTSEANGTIDDVVLANPGAAGANPVLMHADGLAVTKTSADTLKVFVNHNFLG